MKPELGDGCWCVSAPRVPLLGSEVHLWRVFLDGAAALAYHQESWLSPVEEGRVGGFRLPRDRQRFRVRRGSAQ